MYLHESCTGSFAVKIRCNRDMKAQEQFVKNENDLFMSFQTCFFTAISQMFSIMSCDVPCLIVSTKRKHKNYIEVNIFSQERRKVRMKQKFPLSIY